MPSNDLFLFAVSVWFMSTVWVISDSTKRQWGHGLWDAVGWMFVVFFGWVLFFPLYLAKRQQIPLKPHTEL